MSNEAHHGISLGPDAPQAAVSDLVEAVFRHPLHREIYYQVLSHCAEERQEDEVEAYVEALPQHASAMQGSHALIGVLVDQGGLARRAYDETGAVVDEARVQELRAELAAQWAAEHGEDGRPEGTPEFEDAVEDALYELVARRTLVTTGVGAAVVAMLDPQRRISAYVDADPGLSRLYLELLGFCAQKRTLGQINELFADDPALDPSAASDWQRIRPSFLIDRMNEAGALVWDGGWVVTEAGASFLAGA